MVSLSINQGVADSWSKHHAAKNRRVVNSKGKQAILPLIDAAHLLANIELSSVKL